MHISSLLIIQKADVNKVVFEHRYVTDNASYFSDKRQDIFDAMHIHLQPSLKSVEYILNSTIT